LRISTSPLLALFTCCWMSFEAVLGNKEFELVVFGVTFAVVTRYSASGQTMCKHWGLGCINKHSLTSG
jgi:hypothetical protein